MAGTVIQAFKKERCDSQLVRQWFRKLEHKLQVDGSRADQHFGYIGEVKKELEHLAEQAFECGEPNIPEDLSQAVKIAADYAARHYREAVGLGDAAEVAEVNSTYLSYLFSQEMGIGFAGYLLKLRIEYAKKLLRETNLKMWQVAEQSGFNDYHYFSKVFKKSEKMSPAQALAVAGAFIGSLFVIKPTFTNMALVPSLIGLCGGICAGIAYAMVRILGQRGQKGSSVVIFFSGFSCVVTLPYLLLDFHPMSGLQILTLLGAGLAAAGGQFGITAAYYHAPAKEISIYDYSQIIFSTILGFFLFGQVPDRYSVLGYVIICAMALWMFVYNKNRE